MKVFWQQTQESRVQLRDSQVIPESTVVLTWQGVWGGVERAGLFEGTEQNRTAHICKHLLPAREFNSKMLVGFRVWSGASDAFCSCLLPQRCSCALLERLRTPSLSV